MEAPKKILVVDDSVVVRRMLSRIIDRAPGLEVSYAASSGSLGLSRLEVSEVDLVLLDIEMADMSGLEVLKRIRERWQDLPVVMCSSLTERGATMTLKALELGATAVIAKPKCGDEQVVADFRTELVAKLSGILLPPQHATVIPTSLRERRVRDLPRHTGPVELLAIGSSTGGPNALAKIYGELTKPLSVPVVIVQHMPPMFTRLLAERLAGASGQPAKEGEHGEPLVPGTTYLAPGGRHMVVARKGVETTIELHDGPLEQSCRPAVDVLFRSVAETYGPAVLATVLTGMGQDGTAGAGVLVDAGASVMVQDAASCVVPSMPTSVREAGFADKVVPLDAIADELYQRTLRHPFSRTQAVSR